MKQFGFGMIALILWVVLICMPAQTRALSTSAQAGESAAAFYRGKTVEFVVPHTPGGTYDILARLLTPYLAKHLGATVIVRNEAGAGGKVAMNRLAKETSGLSLITSATRTTAIAQVFGDKGVRYDLSKFNWLGRISQQQSLIVVGKKSGYKSIPDIQHAKEVKFAAPTITDGKAIRPLVMGHILGINVKAVIGYPGSADAILALLKGEVDGLAVTPQEVLSHIDSQDMFPLLVMAQERIKRLPNIPTIYEVKKLSAQEKKIADICISLDAIGRPVYTTPGVPRERVSLLESVLKKILEDPEVVKKTETIGESIDYASGEETAKFINMMLSISGDEKKMFGKLLGVQGY